MIRKMQTRGEPIRVRVLAQRTGKLYVDRSSRISEGLEGRLPLKCEIRKVQSSFRSSRLWGGSRSVACEGGSVDLVPKCPVLCSGARADRTELEGGLQLDHQVIADELGEKKESDFCLERAGREAGGRWGFRVW